MCWLQAFAFDDFLAVQKKSQACLTESYLTPCQVLFAFFFQLTHTNLYSHALTCRRQVPAGIASTACSHERSELFLHLMVTLLTILLRLRQSTPLSKIMLSSLHKHFAKCGLQFQVKVTQDSSNVFASIL